ncbi:MAG: phosphatase PAP2 family protein [Sulfurovaceae bacterium]|nr:phosphatase PAP2 family protein [Sulfurovaceae bacterium]MDD5549440.1 phosphatase PAP2 family protein [Sulfurovaceae bacterium]
MAKIDRFFGHFVCKDDSSFWNNLKCRFHSWWCFKFFGTSLFIGIFFIIYFYLLKNIFFPITIIPITSIDNLVNYNIYFLFIYISLWVYVSLPPLLMPNPKEVFYYGIYAGILMLIGILFYIFFPTTISQDASIWNDSESMKYLKKIDLAGNAFPSMHVASSLFSYYWIKYHLQHMGANKFFYILNLLWCVGIIYSTMATKQHLFYDVLGGAILGSIVAFFTIRDAKKRFYS